MAEGSNLPESTGPNDPDAPWNKGGNDDLDLTECSICGELMPEDELDDHVCFGDDEEGEE